MTPRSFRNRQEVELVMDTSESAAKLDSLLENYEMISFRAQSLQESWDSLCACEESHLVPAVTFIGEQMSRMNRMRAILLKKMDAILEHLQVLAKSLLQYAEVNSSIAEELKMEGIERLANDKIFVANLEQELVKRVNIICTKGSIQKLCPMSDFIKSLIRMPELIKPTCEETAPNGCCNSLNEISQPQQGIVPNKLSSMQSHEQRMENVCGSARDSWLQAVHSVTLLQQNIQRNDIGQSDKALALPVAHGISSMAGSFTTGASAQNDILVPNNSCSASEEQLPELVLEKGLVSSQMVLPNPGKLDDIGDEKAHLRSQSVSSDGKDGMHSLEEPCETAGNNSSVSIKKAEECRDLLNFKEDQNCSNLSLGGGGKTRESPSPSSCENESGEDPSDNSPGSNVNECSTDAVFMTQAHIQEWCSPDLVSMTQAVTQDQYVSGVHNNVEGSKLPCKSSEGCCTGEGSSRHAPALIVRPHEYGNIIGKFSASGVVGGKELNSVYSQFHEDPKDPNVTNACRTLNSKDMLPCQWRETERPQVDCPDCTYSRDVILKNSLNSTNSPCDPQTI